MKNDLVSNIIAYKGKEGHWLGEYDYYFMDDIYLKCRDYMTLYKDGRFKEFCEYYYQGDLMATSEETGKWDIVYDSDLDTFLYEEENDRNISTENVNFKEEWFKKFDNDLREWSYLGYLEDDDEDDDDTMYGLEIVDCSKDLFLLRAISNGTLIRYEPGVKYFGS